MNTGSGLKLFVVQDSDWDWDSKRFPGVFVWATDMAAAGQAAAQKMLRNGEDFDAAHLKVARCKLLGFVSLEKQRDGSVVLSGDPVMVDNA